MRRRLWFLVFVILLGLLPGPTHAQVFLASAPHPEFAIGPLFIIATVRPDLGPVTVSISWSLVTPPKRPADTAQQDLYLLWPAEVAAATTSGPADPELPRYVDLRGFTVLAHGRLTLRKRDRAQLGTSAESALVAVSA